MLKRFLSVTVLLIALLVGCDPMSPQPVVVVVTPESTNTPTPAASPTTSPTSTPAATATSNFTPTPTAFPCEAEGSLIELELESTTAGETLRYDVYAPPCYQQTLKRFPVLYLLHGLREQQTQWQDIGIIDTLNQSIRLGALPPMLVVMPYYGSIGTRDSFPPDASYETVVLDELIPAIDRDFCTITNRDQRAIGGIARGGFWAFTLAMRHPDVFGIVGAHSAFFPDDPNEVPPVFSPIDLARNSTLLPEANLRIYLDNSINDDAGSGQKLLADRLTDRSIVHTYIINTQGEHNNDYWATHLGEYLEFYSEEWETNLSALPSCLEPSA